MNRTHKQFFLWSLALILLCTSVPEGMSQTKPEPPPRRPVALPRDTAATSPSPATTDSARESRVRYPSFDVPEYTITGDEARALNAMPRPLSADFPTGGAYRSAGAGTRDAVSSPGEGRRPILDAAVLGAAGGVNVGYGTFRTPTMDLWLSYAGQQADVLLSMGYTSTWGHVENAQSQKGYSTLSGGFSVLETRVRGSFGLTGDGYRLYGSNRPDRWRSVNGILGDLEVGSIRFGDVDAYAGMHIRSTMLEDSLKSSEVQMGFDFHVQADAGPVDLVADAELWANAYTANMNALNPHLYALTVRGRYPVTPVLDIEAGLRAAVRRGTDRNTIGWVDPLLGVYWKGWPDVIAYVRFDPYVEKASLASMVAESPYVTASPHLRPRHYATNVLAGVEFRPLASIRGSVELFVQKGHDVPVYVDLDTTGIWTPVYGGDVRSTGIRGSVAADLSAEDVLQGSITIRQDRWSGTGDGDPRLMGDMVPYSPGVEVDAFAIHRFPFGLSLIPSLSLVGTRPVDVVDSRSLTTYLDIGFRAEYIVLPSFAVTLSFENIFGTKRTFWDRYEGVPSTASLSASYTW